MANPWVAAANNYLLAEALG